MFGKKKYKFYDDEYDESDFDEEENDNALNAILPPPHPVTKIDYIIALCLGIFATIFAIQLMPEGLHPSAWYDCAQAAGLRTPQSVSPGLWGIFSRILFKSVGVSAGCASIAFLGKVTIGLLASFAYLSFRALLALLIRKLPIDGFWNMRLARAIAVVAAFAAICSDPVWMVCQAFTTQAFLVLLLAFTSMMWIRFFRDGKLSAAYFAMFFTGMVMAETPIGFVILILYWFAYVMLLRHGFLGQVELVNLFVKQNAKWYLTFCVAGGFILTIAANIIGFLRFGGLAANSISLGQLPAFWIAQFWQTIFSAASWGGWIVGFGLAVMPLVLVLALVTRATDIEHFLKYQTGLIFFVLACCAYSQLASLHPLWFWTWIEDPTMVNSPVLLALFVFMSSITLLCSMSVLGVDAFCRNNRRLAQQLDPESVAEIEASTTVSRKIFHAIVLLGLFACIILGLVPGRIQSVTKNTLNLLNQYVQQIVEESGDAKWLFTDGEFDCIIELTARMQNRSLACIPLQQKKHARNLRACRQVLADDEDRMSIEAGGGNLLRTWQRDKPARLADSAFMLGLNLWRAHGKPYPAVAGTVARVPGKWSLEEQARFIKKGYQLIDNIFAFYDAGGVSPRAGREVNNLLLFVQWRLARLAKIRSEIFDLRGSVDRAMKENRLVAELDDRNASVKRLVASMARLNREAENQVTLREGLQMVLARADFKLARHYAKPVLTADPNEPNANFAMGMGYFVEGQWARAEEYLKRCLVRHAKEPAVWNNLALVQMRLGRLEDARKSVAKALELMPDSVEIRDTLKQVEEAEKKLKTDAPVEKKRKKIK